MKRYNHLILCSLLIFIISCKETTKSTKSVLETPSYTVIKSPAQTFSSLPFLFSNKDKTLLSWVEKVGDSLFILKYAELLNGQWLNKGEILRGTDWFVNWADYPMIVDNTGNLWSHILKKNY